MTSAPHARQHITITGRVLLECAPAGGEINRRINPVLVVAD